MAGCWVINIRLGCFIDFWLDGLKAVFVRNDLAYSPLFLVGLVLACVLLTGNNLGLALAPLARDDLSTVGFLYQIATWHDHVSK